MNIFLNLSTTISKLVRSILDPKVLPVSYQHVGVVPETWVRLSELDRFILVHNLEKKLVTLDIDEAAGRLPRNRAVKAKDVIVLGETNRNGRAPIITVLMEFLRRKLMVCSAIKQLKLDKYT